MNTWNLEEAAKVGDLIKQLREAHGDVYLHWLADGTVILFAKGQWFHGSDVVKVLAEAVEF